MSAKTMKRFFESHGIFTDRMPQSGKLPVLNFLICQNQVFRLVRAIPCTNLRQTWQGRRARGSAWLCKISPQSPRGWECGQKYLKKYIKKFHFLVKSRPAGVTPLTDFENF